MQGLELNKASVCALAFRIKIKDPGFLVEPWKVRQRKGQNMDVCMLGMESAGRR